MATSLPGSSLLTEFLRAAMDRASADFFFSQVILEYLHHDDSIAAGVPGNEDLHKLVLDSGEIQELPGLVITTGEVEGGSSYKRVLNVILALLYHNRATGADAPQDAASLARSITRERASQMQDAIESRLMDRAAFGAFLGALPPERREGWSITKWRRLPQPPQKRQEKPTPYQSLMMAFELQVFWSRQRGA